MEKADTMQLIPSGGWLGTLTVICADRTGMWEVSSFMVLFLNIWIIIRTTTVEIAMILGFLFDFVIPLQYTSE